MLAAIPDLPRARAPASKAVRATAHDAGATTEDVAALIPVQPGTVRCWLRGNLSPSPKLAPALEQLVGCEVATAIVSLIPPVSRVRAPSSPALDALRAVGANPEDVGALIGANHATIRKWLRGSVRPSPALAAALGQLLDVDTAGRIMALIPPR